MKLWLKYSFGLALGVALYLVIPNAGGDATVAFLADLAIRIGKYALVPFLLFGIPVAIVESVEDGKFWKNAGRTVLLLVAGSLVFTLIGLATAWISSPVRVPLLADTSAAAAPGPQELLLAIFPPNLFSVLAEAGDLIVPLVFLAFALGLAFSHDDIQSRPAFGIFDSLSRTFYQLNTFIAEILGILLIPATIAAIAKTGSAGGIYGPLLAIVAGETVFVAFLAIPLLVYLLGGRKNPFPVIYAFLGPAIAGLASGDIRFAAGTLFKHAKESMGIRRRSNALVIPLGLVFGRAGTALVTSTAFVVILSSYSSLAMSLPNLLWMLALGPFVALIAGAARGYGPIAALTVLCSVFGRGFENGYLVIMPVAFPLAAAGVFLDLLWIGAANTILARREGLSDEKAARHHI